jgi:hypothetical protein
MEPQSDAPYGAWSKVGVPLTIAYSFSAFHEIDFLVNEGYRRIPYGGIEHGGLLFGTRDGAELKIESFRQIECEHAAGPGFSLSSKDVEKIRGQLRNSGTDPELRKMEPLGWFVSFSRRDFTASEAELDQFRSLFPQPWQVMLFVKPEKFKPTRFVFTLPNQCAVSPAKPDIEAFVLPPPGRQRGEPRNKPALENVMHNLNAAVRAVKDFETEPLPSATPRPRKATVLETVPEGSALPDEPVSEQLLLPAEARPAIRDQPGAKRPRTRPKAPLLFGAISALLIAACGVWFYRNYEQSAIELHAEPVNPGIVVTWPADETSESNEAELRIWIGRAEQVVQLSSAEKHAGRAAVPVKGDDITIQLLSHHWLQDRRGMVRLLRAAGK